jgi:hypothetical protein
VSVEEVSGSVRDQQPRQGEGVRVRVAVQLAVLRAEGDVVVERVQAARQYWVRVRVRVYISNKTWQRQMILREKLTVHLIYQAAVY